MFSSAFVSSLRFFLEHLLLARAISNQFVPSKFFAVLKGYNLDVLSGMIYLYLRTYSD